MLVADSSLHGFCTGKVVYNGVDMNIYSHYGAGSLRKTISLAFGGSDVGAVMKKGRRMNDRLTQMSPTGASGGGTHGCGSGC